MGIFSNPNSDQQNQPSPQKLLQAQYSLGRREMLFVVILTVVNVGFLLFNADSYFLLSIMVPYYSVAFGMAFAENTGLAAFTAAGIAVAVMIIAAYLLLYIFSKKRAGCLTALLVLFSLDTLAVIGIMVIDSRSSEGNAAGFLLEIFFRCVVIFTLVRAVIAASKLKKLGIAVNQADALPAINVEAVPQNGIPFDDGRNGESKAPEDFEGEAYGQKQEETSETHEEEQSEPQKTEIVEPEYKTEPVGAWDGQGKIRLAAIHNGVEVKTVRKFSCTELIIDGKVYDTFDRIIESGYTLAAEVNGVKYVYTQNSFGEASLSADGETIASGTFAV